MQLFCEKAALQPDRRAMQLGHGYIKRYWFLPLLLCWDSQVTFGIL